MDRCAVRCWTVALLDRDFVAVRYWKSNFSQLIERSNNEVFSQPARAVLFFFFEFLFDELHEHVDGGIVMSTLWDNDIRIAFACLNKLFVHRF